MSYYSHCLTFRSIHGTQELFLFPLSLVLQIYAIAHITCYRWKYQRQDNRVHVFTINNGMNGKWKENPEANPGQKDADSPNPNTKAHNEILFGIKNMLFIIVSVGGILVSSYCLSNLWNNDYNSLHSIFYYTNDFFPMFVVNTMFPCYFYSSNCNARKYLKQVLFNA